MQSVSKHLPDAFRKALGWEPASPVSFTLLAEIESALQRRIADLNIAHRIDRAVQAGWQTLRGRI